MQFTFIFIYAIQPCIVKTHFVTYYTIFKNDISIPCVLEINFKVTKNLLHCNIPCCFCVKIHVLHFFVWVSAKTAGGHVAWNNYKCRRYAANILRKRSNYCEWRLDIVRHQALVISAHLEVTRGLSGSRRVAEGSS